MKDEGGGMKEKVWQKEAPGIFELTMIVSEWSDFESKSKGNASKKMLFCSVWVTEGLNVHFRRFAGLHPSGFGVWLEAWRSRFLK